jgi:cyclomaltodextrinase
MSAAHWAQGSVFYHIYPLGLCAAPARNDFTSSPQPRIEALFAWLEHARRLGANALYLGPLFESSSHGYDTADYFRVDRRLGRNEDLSRFCRAARDAGMRVIFDAVFNHVGRAFWAFTDVLQKGKDSAYKGWFRGVDFNRRSPNGDSFAYEGWNGHYSLVKLDVRNPEVKEHLFAAVSRWVEEFGIDGLRLDAADCIDMGFLQELASFSHRAWPGFWLLGEIIHGDYRRWANPSTLDSVTNYECYKGLYSSHVDDNYFEIAYSLNRQFGPTGLYRGLSLYSFADNHDVNRVASSLKDPADLGPLYCLLFTMPGVPSIYYGSEWGIAGVKDGSDRPLRPALDLPVVARESPHAWLADIVRRLSRIRHASPALQEGDYLQLHVAARQIAFLRRSPQESILVAVNAGPQPVSLDCDVPGLADGQVFDLLAPGRTCMVSRGKVRIESIPAGWARILSTARRTQENT